MKEHGGWYWPDSDDFMWREMRDGSYQRSHFDKAMEFVTDRRCAIDVGAHVGHWSALMASEFESVLAVEPAEDSFQSLLSNMLSRRLDNVVPCPVAVGNSDEFVSMAIDQKQAARKNTGGRYVRLGGGAIRMETIDSWRLPALGFLKIDAEGSEPLVIQGAEFTIARCKPVVLFEDKGFCVRYGLEKTASQRALAALGYEHKARVGHDEIYVPRL